MDYFIFNFYFFVTWILITIGFVVVIVKLPNKDDTNSDNKTLDICDDICCNFAIWLQDNYSTNKKQGGNTPLPKGYWRKDFTDEHYKTTELFVVYKEQFCS